MSETAWIPPGEPVVWGHTGRPRCTSTEQHSPVCTATWWF